jgi:hypothetical protein
MKRTIEIKTTLDYSLLFESKLSSFADSTKEKPAIPNKKSTRSKIPMLFFQFFMVHTFWNLSKETADLLSQFLLLYTFHQLFIRKRCDYIRSQKLFPP